MNFESILRRLETKDAQIAALADSLERLAQHVRKIGGFMKSEDQAMLRGVRALLVEHGRKP
jgi:hypothetical protein